MVQCANHPDREAVVKCRRCGRNFCDGCIDKLGEYSYCFECLKDIVHESRGKRYGHLTGSLALGVVASVLIGLAILWANRAALSLLASALRAGMLPQYFAGGSYLLLVLVGLACAFYFTLAIGIIANKRWALPLGLGLACGLFIFKVYELTRGKADEPLLLAVQLVGPLVLIASLYSNRRLFVS